MNHSCTQDKRPLTDARKLIETEMERFKVCEKEFKTKAFSKEGLSQAPKEDPKEKEKNKVRKWIATALETIQERKDVYEAELETINSAKKKKKDSGAARWEDLIERCRYHEERLELILRLIDNDSLAADDVEQIKEQLEYLLEQMVEGNADEVDGIDDDTIYEDLGLDELSGVADEDATLAAEKASEISAASGKAPDKTPDKKRAAKEREEEERKEKEKKKEKDRATASVTELPSINAAALKAKPQPKDTPAVPSKGSVSKDLLAGSTPKLMSAATTAAAVTSGTASTATATVGTAAARSKAAVVPISAVSATAVAPGAANATLTTQDVHSGRAGGLPPPAGASTLADAARSGRRDEAVTLAAATLAPDGTKSLTSGVTAASAVAGGGAGPACTGLPPPSGRGAVGSPCIGEGIADSGAAGGAPMLPSPPGPGADYGAGRLAALGAALASEPVGGGDNDSVLSGFVHSLVPGGCASDLTAMPSDGALSADLDKAAELMSVASAPPANPLLVDETMTRQLLKFSLLNKPEQMDSERPRTYVPRNPYPTPNSFPQTPASVFDAPSTFDKFDTDTLFFIFYYQQGTYQQYLAARELKRQSWRYHRKYLTWFQRHEEPKVTAEDYEQGTYVYFDYETGWCQRIKSEFTFEYGYLEDELQV